LQALNLAKLVSHVACEAPKADEDEAAALPTSDAELVSAIASGERDATLRLYRLVAPVIDRTLLRVLGGRDRDHEDLMQLSLEHLLRSLLGRKFRLECSLQHWAAVLSSHLAIAELRRRTRASQVLSPPLELEDLGSECVRGWEGSAREQETRDLVRRALSTLRPERATVLYLFEVEGLQLGEIAALMRVSVSSVQSRLVRGRKQFAESFESLSSALFVSRQRQAP
jgi:RNA polymerase sigma-70 factor (ECF subfamily)